MVFVLLGVDATLGDGCRIWEHLHSFRKWNVSRVIPGLSGWVYKTRRFFPLADEHSVVVMTAGSQSRQSQLYPMGSEFSISVWLNLCSESVGAWHFEILAEDSNNGGPSSFTVRMEYLFAFQFWYCELCVENRWGEREEAESVVLLML